MGTEQIIAAAREVLAKTPFIVFSTKNLEFSALAEAVKMLRSALDVHDAEAPRDGESLWIWRNGDHYLAFRHLYPCVEPGGDPMVLGNPVGRAVFKLSFDRATPPTTEKAP